MNFREMTITIFPMEIEDAQETSALIARVLLETAGTRQPKKAFQELVDYLTWSASTQQEIINFFSRNPVRFVARKGERVVGVVYGSKEGVLGLFVDQKYSGYGIGIQLLHRFEQRAKEERRKGVHLWAFPSVVTFYTQQGYKKTTGIRKVEGLWMQPMIKMI